MDRLTTSDLEQAFQVHFDEMVNCESNKCYWALLHLVVVLPDICSAIESPGGDTNGNLYKNWCDKYLSGPDLSGVDWYEMRNGLLHQGSTVAKKGKYGSFSYGQPTSSGGIVHRITFKGPSGKEHIHVDVGQLKTEMLVAVRKWFETITINSEHKKSQNVRSHLSALAKVNPESLSPFIRGASQTISLTHTSTSIPPRRN